MGVYKAYNEKKIQATLFDESYTNLRTRLYVCIDTAFVNGLLRHCLHSLL